MFLLILRYVLAFPIFLEKPGQEAGMFKKKKKKFVLLALGKF